jgi:twitching motility protein PilI
MAAKGFIKLLEIAERSRQRTLGLAASGQASEYWSGVGFSLAGQYFVAPMGEVAEVLSVPRYTSVPGVKNWMKGLANVRGRLLPIMDLLSFLNRPPVAQDHRRRLIVVDQGDIFSGLVVDEVLGMQHFSISDYRAQALDLPELAPYVQGGFVRDGRLWSVFLVSRLVEDPQFLQAAAIA